MDEADRTALETFLGSALAYGLAEGEPVTRIDTHISAIFLAGPHAYKLKKPVDFGYLDFTTLERRKAACLHELELNRRTAPEIYLDVVPVVRDGDRFSLGNFQKSGKKGPIVEWLLKMVRFEQADVLAAKADSNTLEQATIEELAREVEKFHEGLVAVDAGGAARFEKVLLSNAENFAPFKGDLYPRGLIERLNAHAQETLDEISPLLDTRRAAGWVRHCHGDLHLGNVAVIKGHSVLFDCIEFNDDFARIDVLYDLAFLIMDLAFRAKHNAAFHGFANVALNAYLQASPVGDWRSLVEGLQALPFFMSARAAVRSHVNARTWATAGTENGREMAARAALAYAEFAFALLTATTPGLWAVGGLSGTGKTTLAKALAPHLPGPAGALHLRTDILRKKLAGVRETDRLPSSAYTKEASDAVYEEMMRIAGSALTAGQSVICDAVFAQADERALVEKVARERGVRFSGLWLEADTRALGERIERRTLEGKDASDATLEVVAAQERYDLGRISWARIDANGARADVLARSLGFLELAGP